MTFLAALTTGAVVLVRQRGERLAVGGRARGHHPGAASCRGAIIEADVRAGGRDRARDAGRCRRARLSRKEESARLVEPWLGSGLSLDDLPIPRLIVVKLASGARPDFAALRQALAAQVAGATLDDHRRWIDRMRAMAGTAVAAGVAVLALVSPSPCCR